MLLVELKDYFRNEYTAIRQIELLSFESRLKKGAGKFPRMCPRFLRGGQHELFCETSFDFRQPHNSESGRQVKGNSLDHRYNRTLIKYGYTMGISWKKIPLFSFCLRFLSFPIPYQDINIYSFIVHILYNLDITFD